MTEFHDPAAYEVRKLIWRRWRWRFAGALGLFALVVAVYIIQGYRRLDRQLAEIRACGEPVSMEELAEYYTYPPADQDATRLWVRGIEAIPENNWEENPRPARVDLPWPELESARRFLQDNAPAIQDLRDAAALGGQARYPVTFAGHDTRLEHAQQLRRAARCLALEADLRARDGDMRGAAESLIAGLMASDSLANEPTLISQIVRVSILHIMIDEFQRIGPSTFSASELSRLHEALAGIDLAPGLKRGMCGERAWWIKAFDDSFGSGEIANFILAGSAAESSYLTAMEQCVCASELPWNERLPALEKATAQRKSYLPNVTNLLMPALQMPGCAFARAETVKRLAIVEIAITKYQHQHGRPPTELTELTPAFLADIPHDPLTAASFSYKTNGEGHTLYSASKELSLLFDDVRDLRTGVNSRFVFRRSPPPEPGASNSAEQETPAEVLEGESASTEAERSP